MSFIKQIFITLQGYLYPDSYRFTDIIFKVLKLKGE